MSAREWVAFALVVVGSGAWPAAGQPRDVLCPAASRSPEQLRRQLEPLGEPAVVALVALAQSPNGEEVACGIAGLSALGDLRAVPLIAAALRDPARRDEAYQVARWAAALAGRPSPDLGEAMLPVVDALDDPAVVRAAGNDAIWLLGEIDHERARDRLLGLLDRPQDDAALDAVVHALARQGDSRARARIAGLGDEAARAKSGNATPEQARRLGEVAFYQLALGPDSLEDGLATLRTVALRDQQDAAAWAVHTLCARAERRPAERASIEADRARLVAALEQAGVSWSSSRVPGSCPP